MTLSRQKKEACGLLLAAFLATSGQHKVLAADRPTTLFFVQRTKAHVKLSKPAVFHAVVDDLTAYLDKKHVAIAKDEFGGRTHAEAEMPLSTVLAIARDSRASYLLYLIVDRPVMKWIKVTVRAYDLNGEPLWEETVASGGGIAGGHGLRVALERLHRELDKRLGQPGLPLSNAVENATQAPEQPPAH